MDYVLLRTPSVGSLTKKVLAINPDLRVPEIISIIREAMEARGSDGLEVVNEAKVLELAQATLAGRDS